MSRLRELFSDEAPNIGKLTAVGEGAPSLDKKCLLLEQLRAHMPEGNKHLDRLLLRQIAQLGEGLQQARANLHELKEQFDKLTAPPWLFGVFLEAMETPEGPRALVYDGNARRVVNVAEQVELDCLETGDSVYLNGELSAVTGKPSTGVADVGETVTFDRYTDDGRLVVKSRDEELICEPAAALRQVDLSPGDEVRWDRSSWLAYEKIQRAAGRRFLLENFTEVRPEHVGGQQHNLQTILTALTRTLVEPKKAEMYRLNGKQGILMQGPPGCGKTLMARVAVTEIRRISSRKCTFGVVKPAEWEDPYVGVTQQNIRNCFQAMREAAEDGFAVLFMDEIEAVGRIRGSAVSHHNDKFLAALLAELDGFIERGGVAVIAATNRKHLCEPALLERFDTEIEVDRPDMRGAREIFEIHLPDSIPFSPNGEAARGTRQEAIERAVSRLYAPNADNELCVIKFRDGKTRTITARELLSGRTIEQICRAACQAAFLRDVQSDQSGVRVEDIDEAVAGAIHRLSKTLNRRNAHAYVADLPDDVDVVAVEPIFRRVDRKHRYLNDN